MSWRVPCTLAMLITSLVENQYCAMRLEAFFSSWPSTFYLSIEILENLILRSIASFLWSMADFRIGYDIYICNLLLQMSFWAVFFLSRLSYFITCTWPICLSESVRPSADRFFFCQFQRATKCASVFRVWLFSQLNGFPLSRTVFSDTFVGCTNDECYRIYYI